MTTIIGAILIIIGVVFLGKGVGDVLGRQKLAPLTPFSRFIEAITKFIEALTKAPRWLSSTIIGVLLILLGAWIGGWLPMK